MNNEQTLLSDAKTNRNVSSLLQVRKYIFPKIKKINDQKTKLANPT
jgi:hypothetical protein